MNNGTWEQVSLGKSTFIMYLCDHKLKNEIEDTIQFVIKSEDVTDKLVNEGEYIFKPRIIKEFDYVKFEKSYTELYLKEATIEYAHLMIQSMGDNSRYIDHQVVLKNEKNR